ncbi:MAG: fumarylacetoacetate hydrolase family protein [Clostridia bacterium]|jgi:2-keto-4-pentenoate hydratase/2-oxohepta-3-ene-1,7-dioic acid hydratase in catechol pathway
MKIVRAEYGLEVFYGILDEGRIKRLKDVPFQVLDWDGRCYDLKEVKLLPPCEPSKIIAVGVNYNDHAVEMGHDLAEDPIIFLKPPTVLIGPEDSIIILLPSSQRVDYEGELAVVIGKECKAVSAEEADRYILGCTCFNDVTARDLQRKDGQWTRGKSFDTFGPTGPWIETEINYNDVEITTLLNDKIMQRSRTSRLIHPIDKLVSYISRIMTLMPGDIIATGTPAGVGPMQEGDCVQVRIEGIGTLRNYVVK